MENSNLNSLKELSYAELSKNEENKLRDLEKSFNYEFGKDYYFMVMKRENEGNK